MRYTFPLNTPSNSSRAWISRQNRDPYVRQRAASAYRSRSAFKLLEIDKKHRGFLSARRDLQAVVDLGAAPGGWSQVVSEKLGWIEGGDEEGEGKTLSSYTQLDEDEDEPSGRGRGTIIAIDLIPMLPIPGVHFLQMDFLHPSSASHLVSLLPEGKADVVLSDMAPNMSGNKVSDEEKGMEISEAVWEFSRRVLRIEKGGGTLLIKHHHSPLLQHFRRTALEPHFRGVQFIKPQASRKESSEGYFLCTGFRGFRS